MEEEKKNEEKSLYDRDHGLVMAAGRKEIHERMVHAVMDAWGHNGEFAPLLDRKNYRDDLIGVGDLAHRCAGSCRMCGMLRLADCLSSISSACDTCDPDMAGSIGRCLPELLRLTREQILSQ